MKDRVGQQIQICTVPLMITEITGWDEARQLWQAHYIVPEKMQTTTEFREDFLQFLDDTQIEDEAEG